MTVLQEIGASLRGHPGHAQQDGEHAMVRQ
jgi:hypothetical protein